MNWKYSINTPKYWTDRSGPDCNLKIDQSSYITGINHSIMLKIDSFTWYTTKILNKL